MYIVLIVVDITPEYLKIIRSLGGIKVCAELWYDLSMTTVVVTMYLLCLWRIH